MRTGPGRVRLLVLLGQVGLREIRTRATTGLHLSIFLGPLSTWLKWGVAGIPTSRIPFYPSRLDLLEHAAGCAGREGLWLEFGVWKGESINHIAPFVPGPIYGFDSFEGLPERWTPGWQRGSFSTGGIPPRSPGNVVFVKGLFGQTLRPFLDANQGRAAAFVHIDCDLYSSTRFVLEELSPRIVRGTVIVFDEYTGMMPDDEARAFREIVRSSRLRFRYLGCSASGSLAVEIL